MAVKGHQGRHDKTYSEPFRVGVDFMPSDDLYPIQKAAKFRVSKIKIERISVMIVDRFVSLK